jgi:quinol monooxygenase YgiN
MKRKWILGLCVAVLAAATVVGARLSCSRAAAATGELGRIPAQELPHPVSGAIPPFEVTWARGVLEAANMYFPAELEMLEVIHSEPTKQQAVEIAAAIGVPPSAELLAAMPEDSTAEEGCYRWEFARVDVSVSCDGNLGLFWRDRDPVREHFENPTAKPASALTVDEAVAIADRFVKETGLLAEGARMVEVIPKTAVSRYKQATGKDETTVVACSVIYRRFRDGIPEGSLGVTLNGKGEIVKVNKNMRNVRSLGRYPILRPDEAREMIWSPASRVIAANAPSLRPVTAVIEKVKMEYYDGGTSWSPDTIQPIYIFTGTTWDRQGRRDSFEAMVPAVRPEYLEPLELPRPFGAVASGKIRDSGASGSRESEAAPMNVAQRSNGRHSSESQETPEERRSRNVTSLRERR